MGRLHFKHHQKHKKWMEENAPCCTELKIRHEYKRFHRFFLFSPLFIFFVLTVGFFASRGELPKESYKLLIALLVLVTIKEVAGVFVSRRIYNDVLRPVEDLKKALFEVSKGNYGVEVTSTNVDEFNQLIQAFNAMSLRLKASEEMKAKYETNRKELVASISHDLKTPITSINGFVDGILEGVADDPSKQEAYCRIIQQNARYMNRLIDDLLLYSKLDLHKLNFEFAPISFSAYVNELFQELNLENEENGMTMTFENHLNPNVQLSIDPKHFTRAIRNIVSNAVTYGKKEGGWVQFQLSEISDEKGLEGNKIELNIRDNGGGIPTEQLEVIFERFYRGTTARTMENGSSGLGLAIAKEIVEAHGGCICAESVMGEGTTIRLQLPTTWEVPTCQNLES